MSIQRGRTGGVRQDLNGRHEQFSTATLKKTTEFVESRTNFVRTSDEFSMNPSSSLCSERKVCKKFV